MPETQIVHYVDRQPEPGRSSACSYCKTPVEVGRTPYCWTSSNSEWHALPKNVREKGRELAVRYKRCTETEPLEWR